MTLQNNKVVRKKGDREQPGKSLAKDILWTDGAWRALPEEAVELLGGNRTYLEQCEEVTAAQTVWDGAGSTESPVGKGWEHGPWKREINGKTKGVKRD